MSRLIFIIVWLFLLAGRQSKSGARGEGYSPIKVTGVLVGNSITPLKGTRILFYGRVPNSFPPLRGTNSSTINYTELALQILTVIKITLNSSFQGSFESIVIYFYTNKAYQQSF